MFRDGRTMIVSALISVLFGVGCLYVGITVPAVWEIESDLVAYPLALQTDGSTGTPVPTMPLMPSVASTDLLTGSDGYVTEAELNERMAGFLYHTRWLLDGEQVTRTTSDTSWNENESLADWIDQLDRQLFAFMDEANDDLRDLSDDIYDTLGSGFELASPTITNGILAGTNYTLGSFGIGTSSPADLLAVAGAIYLADTTPTSTVDRLYNNNGDLYWSGSVLVSSSTGTWTASGGDVYRLLGSVGIGTDTPTETLTVAGTFSAGTTTARLVDTGGQVCNVDAYGAVGNNSTDNYVAIMAAIDACPEGGVVFFPMGQYRISQTIVLDKPVTLRGSYSPRWSYSSTPRSSIRAAFGSFTGGSVIHVRDKSISGEASDNNGGRIENLSIDGGSTGSGVEGIYFEGLVRDWKLTDVDISQASGNGFEAAVGTGSGNPRGFTIRGLSIYSAGGHGFRATALNDTYIDDLLVVGNALRGIYLSSMGETKINSSRAVFNALEGLYIDGSTNNGGLTFTDFSTDRNDRHGVRIAATGTTTITFNGLLTRRDGPNNGGGTETPYAGVAIIGSTTAKTAPIFITGLSQTVGLDDSHNPPIAPSVGVRVANATYVKIDGQLWGVDDAYIDGGGNSNFIIEDDSVLKTGTDDTQELYTNNRKWVATSTGLFYGNSVSIGSTTGSRLLNIIAPEQAGARFQDTTNNVIFDMRAEDYQGFFGTFSNHQLRFQTNNTSRLTIDLDGDIGIGTTSPTARLHVDGTVRLQSLGNGTVISDANGNLSVSSDERLKNVAGLYTAGLDDVLGLEPIRYHWNEASGMETETLYAGFSAQNVQDFLPEAVGEDERGFLTLSDRPILAALVNSIKELWQTVTGNQQRIDRLEERVAELESVLLEESSSAPAVVDEVLVPGSVYEESPDTIDGEEMNESESIEREANGELELEIEENDVGGTDGGVGGGVDTAGGGEMGETLEESEDSGGPSAELPAKAPSLATPTTLETP